MTMVQMNVRIDEDLKRTGDDVLASTGRSPTHVVRTIWGYAAQCKDDPSKIEALLREAEQSLSPDSSEERATRMRMVEEGPNTWDRFLAEMGIDGDFKLEAESSSPSVLREQAAVERARKKGWLDE